MIDRIRAKPLSLNVLASKVSECSFWKAHLLFVFLFDEGWSTLRGSNHNHNDQLDHLNPSTSSSSSSAIYAVPNNKKVQMLQDDRNHNGVVSSAYGSILSVRDTLMMSTCCPLHPNGSGSGGGDAPSTLLPSSSLSSPSTVSLSLNSDQDQDQESLFSNESIHSNSSNGSNHGNSVSYSGRTGRLVADSSTQRVQSLNRKYSFTHHSSNTMDCNGQSCGSKWATLDNGACCSMTGNQVRMFHRLLLKLTNESRTESR